jgi:hypothetical protein
MTGILPPTPLRLSCGVRILRRGRGVSAPLAYLSSTDVKLPPHTSNQPGFEVRAVTRHTIVDVCSCEGFQTPAVANIPTRTAAGV